MFKKKIKPFIFALAVMMGVYSSVSTVPVYATPSIEELEESIQKSDNEIIEAMEKMNELNSSIVEKEVALAQAENEFRVLQNEYDIALEKYSQKLRSTYKNGGFDSKFLLYVDAILSGNSITDVFNRMEFVKRIHEHEKELMSDIKDARQMVEDKRVSIEKENETLKAEKDSLQSHINDMEAKKSELMRMLQEQSAILINTTLMQAPIEVSAEASEKAKIVINEAQKYLGVPYVWGGTSPSGFDCSGLTQYVYRKVNVSIPRVASSQQNTGFSVSKEHAKPGDMVFFGNPAHHVGIYLGNGQYLHAPRTGDVVKISPINWAKVSTVSRVLN